jgi:hypothetical protein
MNRLLYGTAAAALLALAPAMASAQNYYAPTQPYYGYGAPAYPAYPAPAYTAYPAPGYPAYTQPNGYYGSSVPYGYNAPAPYTWGSFPTVNMGQASASAHGPSYDNVQSQMQSH